MSGRPPAIARLARRWRNVVLVHPPIHASWLGQIEIVFSILQRNVLTPNTFELPASILAFEERYQAVANPFEWKYTRDDLAALLARLTAIPTCSAMSWAIHRLHSSRTCEDGCH